MNFEEDVKIADFSSSKFKKVDRHADRISEYKREDESGNLEKAKHIGRKIASKLIENINKFSFDGEENTELIMQKGTLLAFAATVGMEENIFSEVVLDATKSSFNKYIEKEKGELYRHFLESGAFSFYYLAYRRGSEVDRRIGQTFAMLCAHDGDSVYQELGEAIYCWFLTVTSKIINEA